MIHAVDPGLISQPQALGFPGFDGIDWDLEGNDTPMNKVQLYNTYTDPCCKFLNRNC